MTTDDKISDRLAAYREMERKLAACRRHYHWRDSTDEDELLEEMDALWYELTPYERTLTLQVVEA